ncbi:MAG: protease inhibitor I42 family protein [Chloroflexi bacterium]|nr:protease inhibitor I42 family protein [Chloroflexota bacterium]
MSRKILSLVTLAVVLILATACSPTKQANLTTADNGSQVEVKVGEQIFITLDGNPSTGYTWESKDLDTTMFEQVGDPAFSSSNPDLIGSGGTLTLTFKALKAGTAALTLVYHRPWETGVDPIDTFAVTVTVK